MDTHRDTQGVITTVRLPVEQREALERLAAMEERSLSGQLRVAVSEHLASRATAEAA